MNTLAFIRNTAFIVITFSILPSRCGAAELRGGTTTAALAKEVLSTYSSREVLTPRDNPWLIFHSLLAFGAASEVRVQPQALRTIPYLILHARTPDDQPLFVPRASGALWPETDPLARHQVQDHRNQVVAKIAQVCVLERGITGSPDGVSRDQWRRVLQGTWDDYRLDDEPSWTLICYLCYLPSLAAPRDEVLRRIEAILRVLARPEPPFELACGGAHRLQALAIYWRSAYRRDMPAALNEEVSVRLQEGLVQISQEEQQLAAGANLAPARTARATAEFVLERYGHALEWMCFFLGQEQLRSPEVTAIVHRLCQALRALQDFELADRGASLHALHALRLYVAKTT